MILWLNIYYIYLPVRLYGIKLLIMPSTLNVVMFEEGISLTPDLEASKLFYNIAYGAKRESLFFAPYIKGSLF